MASMKKMQDILDENETRMRTASLLLTNLSSISVGHHLTYNTPPAALIFLPSCHTSF